MQIFNTMTRKKEDFIPQEPGVYRIYVAALRCITISISAMRAP